MATLNKENIRHVAYIVSMAHGLEAWTYREIEALAEKRFKISIFPLRYRSGPYMPKKEWPCYRIKKGPVLVRQLAWFFKHPILYLKLFMEALSSKSLGYFGLAVYFANRMAKNKVELIHCVFGDHKFFVGYYCKKMLDIPLSVALYGYELKNNPHWTMFRKALPSADTIIVNCDFNKKLLSDIAGADIGARAKVVRHYAPIPAPEAGKKVNILIVGGFFAHKGHDILFKAIRALGSDADRLEVWVVGYAGPVNMEQLAIDLGVSNRVRVFGPVSDQGLTVLYRDCDIFCLPSKTESDGTNEGLPVSLIEAMAHGKPVIATRLSGIPELVEEVLIEEGDIQGLSGALRRFIHNPGLRISSGARNREIIEERYSKRNLEKMIDLWLQPDGKKGLHSVDSRH
jgi:colanic acid/amylovoran biosynthesis glycosyltransferase